MVFFFRSAVGFLTQFPAHVEVLIKLGPELQQLCSALLSDSLQVVREKVHDTMSCYWMTLLKTHPLDRQRDAHFQNLLSISLEKLVYFISRTYEVYHFLRQLHKMNAYS